jgi:hypothetical protein
MYDNGEGYENGCGDGGGRASAQMNEVALSGGCGSPSSYRAVDNRRVSTTFCCEILVAPFTRVVRFDMENPLTIGMTRACTVGVKCTSAC